MNTIKRRKTIVLLLTVLVVLFSAVSASAELVRIDLIPSLRLQEEWGSNVASIPGQKISSFATRINPSLGITMMASDNVSIGFTGGYERVWYYDRDARVANYDTWNIRVDSTGAWAFTPNFSMTPSVYFVSTEESARRSEFAPLGDPILSPVSGVAYLNTKRQSAGTAMDFAYRISPVWNAGFRMNYAREHLKRDGSGGIGTYSMDSFQTGGRASLSYAASPLSNIGLFTEASFMDFEDSPNSQVYTLGVTYSYQFAPALRLFLDAGASHAMRDNELGSDSGNSETGPTGTIRLQYSGQTFEAALFGTTTYSGVSGYGDVTREYQTGILFTQQFAQAVSGSLSGYFQRSESVYQKDSVEIDRVYASAKLTYQPWQQVSFYLLGSAENQKSHGSFGDTTENYAVSLGISMSNPYSIY